MKLQRPHLNGKNGSSQKPFNKENVEFPVSFELKTVIVLSRPKTEVQKEIEGLFNRLKVPFAFVSEKPSSKGNYTSLTFKITLLDEPHMKALYSGLEEIKEIKFAI
jgi:putative lipoic acid-binding regulatory protein